MEAAAAVKLECKAVSRVIELHAVDGSACDVTLVDGSKSNTTQGRPNDSVNESIAFPPIAERTVLDGIWKMLHKTLTGALHVALEVHSETK